MLVSVEIVSRCKLVKAWGVHQVSEIATIYYRLRHRRWYQWRIQGGILGSHGSPLSSLAILVV